MDAIFDNLRFLFATQAKDIQVKRLNGTTGAYVQFSSVPLLYLQSTNPHGSVSTSDPWYVHISGDIGNGGSGSNNFTLSYDANTVSIKSTNNSGLSWKILIIAIWYT